MTFLDESIETLDDGYFAVNYATETTDVAELPNRSAWAILRISPSLTVMPNAGVGAL